MCETPHQDLSGVAETLLITLYLGAMESQRPDALIKDEKAVALVTRMGSDLNRIRRFPMSGENIAWVIRRSQEFDRHARDILTRQPGAAVVHIRCGLNSRFERVDKRSALQSGSGLSPP
jgi:O-methyltransferase involved in polyketide biosynthesis